MTIHPRALFRALLFGLLLASLASPLFAQETRSYIVRLRPGISHDSAASVVTKLGARVGLPIAHRAQSSKDRSNAALLAATRLDRYVVVEGTSDRLGEMLAGASVSEEVFPNHRYRVHGSPNDSAYSGQWALRNVEAEGAWERTSGDSSVIVAIVDTGIDYLHPDLVGAMALNRREDINGNGRYDPWLSVFTVDGVTGDIDRADNDGNGVADDVVGFDFIDQIVPNVGDWSVRDGDPADEFGHGTYVAGIIAATRDNSIGVAGLAPGTRLLALRAFDASGNGEDDDISAAIVYAADRGARVINLSFGDVFYSPLMHDAIRYAYLRGAVIVASSGNEGGMAPHYPSNYPEVISVGATDSRDSLSFFSTGGSQLSLAAPGVDVATTGLGGSYRNVSGTSFAAPYAAATAALVATIHPTWTPDEIRTALELSTDDRGAPGWDLFYGAGRLNARRAVNSPGPASVAITSPLDDEGVGDATVTVRGSAMAPLISSWTLYYGIGDAPEEWTSVGTSKNGRVLDTLGSFSTASIPDTVVTIRLQLVQTNGHLTERRVRLHVDRSRPAVTEFDVRNVWRFEERAVAITLRTDDLTRATAFVRRRGDGAAYRRVSLEPERTGLMRNHYIILSRFDLDRSTPYDLYVELRNAAGDTILIGSPTSPLVIEREEAAFPLSTFEQMPYGLPYGYVLEHAADIDGDGTQTIALNRFVGGDYGKLMLYSHRDTGFVARDSISDLWLPRGFGDSDGDGAMELAAQALGESIVFERPSDGGRMLSNVMFVDTTSHNLWASGFHDFDGDGRDELIARTDNNRVEPASYVVLRWNGTGYDTVANLPNPTPPAADEARNLFGPPESAVGDFDGDGLPELLYGDNDADFVIYERQPSGEFTLRWTGENVGEGGSEMVAAGDLDGDGRDEAIIGYRSKLSQNSDGEYDPPFWTIKIVRINADGTDSTIWSERFAYVRSTNPFRSGITVGQLDGAKGDEAAILIFPSLYVLRWDAAANQLRPFWSLGGNDPAEGPVWIRDNVEKRYVELGASIGNKPIIADFDRDGVEEIGVGNGVRISFFEVDSTFRELEAPAGIHGWAIDERSVHLEWSAAPGASFYTVYRSDDPPGTAQQFDSVATTTGTTFIDTGADLPGGRLANGTFYSYYVVSGALVTSPKPRRLSQKVIVVTHRPARIVAADPVGGSSVRVRMDVVLKDAFYRPGAIDVRSVPSGEEVGISSIVWMNDTTLLATFVEDRWGDSIEVFPTSLLRDYFDTPADTTRGILLRMPRRELDGERFIATRAYPVGGRIAIEFNMPVDPASIVDLSGFTLRPEGRVVSASIDPTDSRRVILTPEDGYPIGPYGHDYTVTITLARSTDGRLVNDGAGSVVGFSFTAETVANVLVYPQPFSISNDREVTFAKLTREASVEIYTQTGSFVNRVEARESNGGARWDGTDATGEAVPSGTYLYRVIGIDVNGARVETELKKIAVVR